MFKPKRLSGLFAMESVDFQSTEFGDRMTSIIKQIFEGFDEGKFDSTSLMRDPLIKMLEDLIFRDKGIRVKFITTGAMAAILPFYPNKNFNMLENWLRGNFSIKHQEEIIKNANGKKGTVDLKKAKVGGLFSEGTSMLYINFYVLRRSFNLTPKEVTAVTLHELGHAFAACEYSDRFTRTNQVLATASREIFKKNGKKNLEYVFKELRSIREDVSIEEVDAIVNGDRIIAGTRWHMFLIDTVISELKNDKYNENQFEQQADSFAARHGYGKELTIGLDKLHHAVGSAEKYRAVRYMQIATNLLILVVLPFMVVAGATTMPVLAIFLGAFWFLFVYGSGDGSRDNTYDELKQRYTRIRAELITMLKDESISKSAVESCVSQIKCIDAAINSTTDVQTVTRNISNLIFTSNRRARKSIEHQKKIEALVSNDLFLSSAQLRTI